MNILYKTTDVVCMKNIVDFLGLPHDVLGCECLCYITGRRGITIENYSRLKSISDTNIEIICKKYDINIIGENLNIEYYNDESMSVGGKICEIAFLQN